MSGGFDAGHQVKADQLEQAAAILMEAAGQIRKGKQDMEHFGD